MKELQPKISVLIIVYNEIAHIDDLINHLNFADEIIVIDAFSTDGTFEKLMTYPEVKTIQRKFLNFSDSIISKISSIELTSIKYLDLTLMPNVFNLSSGWSSKTFILNKPNYILLFLYTLVLKTIIHTFTKFK